MQARAFRDVVRITDDVGEEVSLQIELTFDLAGISLGLVRAWIQVEVCWATMNPGSADLGSEEEEEEG